MHLFVTGAASFIGAELLRLCDERGIAVTGIDLRDVGRPDCRIADIREAAIADHIPQGVDAVVHMAALSRDADCRGRGAECFDVNVMGTLNLIEAAKAKKARQFIFASTEWVYDTFEDDVAKGEDDPIDAAKLTSEYALSKYVSEVSLRQKFQQGFCPVAILRFGIIYGPHRENWSAVESLLHAVATRDEVRVGSLATARHFIHVHDVASAILAAVGVKGLETFNIQGPRLVSLAEVIETSKNLLKRDPAVVETAPGRASIRKVSNEKAEALLDWRPEINLAEGLRSVVNFLGLEPTTKAADATATGA